MSLFRLACFALAGSLLSTAANAANGIEVCKLFRGQQWQPAGEMAMGECLRLIAATESAPDGSELRFGFWGETPLAASDKGYFRSDNGGRRWTPLPASAIPPPPVAVIPQPAVAVAAPAPALPEPPTVAVAPPPPAAPAKKPQAAAPAVVSPPTAKPPASATAKPAASAKNSKTDKKPAVPVIPAEPAVPPPAPALETATPAAAPAAPAAPAVATVDKAALAEAKRQQDEARRTAVAAVAVAPPATAPSSPTVVTQAANNVALVPPPAPAAPSAKTATPATVGSLASCDLRIGRRWQSLDQTSFEACVESLAGTSSGEYDANGLKHGYWGGTFLIADRTAIYRSVDGNAWVKLRDRTAP